MSKLRKTAKVMGIAAASAASVTAAGIYLSAANIVRSSVDIRTAGKREIPGPGDNPYAEVPGIRTVSIKTFDGVELTGSWFPCDDARRTVICVHGWRGSWFKDFGSVIDFLHENNCDLLMVNQRGQQGSGGRYMCFGLLERYDCVEWIRWVNRHTGDERPVYLYGLSMGSTTVMMASSLDLPDNTAGIIADCGFTSPQDEWAFIFRKVMHLPYFNVIRKLTEKGFTRKTGVKGTDYSAEDALRKCRIPVLFVHGGSDNFVPPEMTYKNYEACSSSKEMMIVDGAKHGKSYMTDPESYEAAVRRLWNQCENDDQR